MNSLRKNKVDVRTLSHIKMAAVGSATKLHLEKYGIYADIVPETYYSDAVLELLKQEVNKEDHVLIPCVKGVAYKWEELKQYCSVETIDLYENVAINNEEMKEALTENWDYAVFTCSSAVENTFALGNVNAKQIISIGKMTSATLKEKGVEEIIQSDKANYDALIETIMRL
jgi:uroporphyrinogen III methyltransferase/synthase